MKKYGAFIMTGLAAMLLLPAQELVAQQRQVNPISRIAGIRQDPALTPQYEVAVGRTDRSTKRWMQISISFETAPEWVDELEMRVYVFFNSKSREQPQILFYESVTFLDIPQGRHTEMMFIHPHTMARYVDSIRYIGVEFRHQGRPVAWFTDDRDAREQQWWTAAAQQFPPVSGRMFHTSETPFSLINAETTQLVKEIGTR
jgi:hypothetical protein